jgi:3-oxoacyl-[acyl-carrier protein] reductase
MKLHGKVVVVTGAARGIGRAIALAAVERGATPVLLDLTEDSLQETKDLCVEAGATPSAYACNVASEEQVIATFKKIVERHGAIDVLVNNAGITRDALLLNVADGHVTKRMTIEQWQTVMDVNLTGVFLCGREAATYMVESKTPGVIINVSSISRAGNIGQTNYAATKAGVVAMTVAWAKELARYRIRVGAIAPGTTATEMVMSMKPEARAKLVGAVPLGRCAEVAEMAHAALFIAENDYFTGRVIELDGGLRL